jgi:hypothetical protein
MFKKLCLTSVSAIVFLSFLSTMAPVHGMEEDNKPKKKAVLKKEEKTIFTKK